MTLSLKVVLVHYGLRFVKDCLALTFEWIHSVFQILQFLFLAFAAILPDVSPTARFFPFALGSDKTR